MKVLEPSAGSPPPGPWTAGVVELDHVSAGYGPFRAVFDVSLRIDPGQALALLGSNGAGKTTVARLVTGLVVPTSGRLLVGGDDLTGHHAYEIARRGVAHAPEGRSVFASLTVEENLALGFRQALGRGAGAATAKAYELFPRLGERRQQLAGSLSGGEQRMLSLARVLVNPPALLVVDELSLGLAPIVVDEVYRQLATIKEQGTALLVVEQHVEHALALADDVVVLTRGEVTYRGPAGDSDEVAAYLLPTVETPPIDPPAAPACPPSAPGGEG